MKAWDITRKDLKLLVRDIRTFVVLLALPILFIGIIGMITGRMMGFNEPNRILKLVAVDEIDYEALGYDEAGEPLEEAEAAARRKHARNTFVKILNGIQAKQGFEIREVVASTGGSTSQSAVDEARRIYKFTDVNASLRVGPEFFQRVLDMSHRDFMDSSRGGLLFRFAPPTDLTEFASQRDGLERRIARVFEIDPADVKVFREEVGLESAEIIFQLPKQAANRFFDEQWNAAGGAALSASLVKAARPLELRDVHPSGLRYGLESYNIRLESDAPESATHDLVEVVTLFTVVDKTKLFAFCANTQTRSQVGTSCDLLDAETAGPAIALVPPKKVEAKASRVYQEVIPGYTVLFVFFLINIMARSFIHEKSLGTLRRLRIAPVRSSSLLLGKTLPFLFVSLVQTALLFVFGKIFFGMDWGPQPLLLLPVIFCTSLAATSCGLLVATVVRTEAQVSAYANLVVLLAGLISGSVFPRNWLPQAVKNLSLTTPHAWALIAYDEILSIRQNPDVTIVLQSCAALIGFALLFFAIGTLRFNKVD